jgi:hypothetical protein
MTIDLESLRNERSALAIKIEAIDYMLKAFDDSEAPTIDEFLRPQRQWRIQSQSHPKESYIVKQFYDGSKNCTCLGYTHRFTCKHVDAVDEWGHMNGFKVLESGEHM